MRKSEICVAVIVSMMPMTSALAVSPPAGTSPAGMPPGIYPINGVSLFTTSGSTGLWTDAKINVGTGKINRHQGYTISIGTQTIGNVVGIPGVNIPTNTSISPVGPTHNYNYLFASPPAGGAHGQIGNGTNAFTSFTFHSSQYCGGGPGDANTNGFTVVVQSGTTGGYHFGVPTTPSAPGTLGNIVYTITAAQFKPPIAAGELPAKVAIEFFGYAGVPSQSSTNVRNFKVQMAGNNLNESGNINNPPSSPNNPPFGAGFWPWTEIQNLNSGQGMDSDFNFDTAPFTIYN